MNKIKDKILFGTPIIEIPKNMIIENKKGKKKLKKTLTNKNNLTTNNKKKAIIIQNTKKDEINIINPGDKIKVNVKVNKKDDKLLNFEPKLQYLDLKNEIKDIYKDLNDEELEIIIKELIKANFNKKILNNNISQTLRDIELAIPIKGINNNSGVQNKFKKGFLNTFKIMRDIFNKINIEKYIKINPYIISEEYKKQKKIYDKEYAKEQQEYYKKKEENKEVNNQKINKIVKQDIKKIII